MTELESVVERCARLPELRKALNARSREHHGFLVAQVLAHIDYLEEAIGQVDERISASLERRRRRWPCG